MELPNYFLADLPPEAEFTPSLIREACDALRRNRALYLAHRPIANILRVVSDVAHGWCQPDSRFRQAALAQGPAATGFSAETLARGIDEFFAHVTRPNLERWLEQELGHPRRLEDFCSMPLEEETQRAALACAPELVGHVTAGAIPNPTWMSILSGLVLRSAQFVKCPSGCTLLPRLFAHSIYEADPKLGACLELAAWPGGSLPLEDALFASADCLTVTGSDKTLAEIRRRVPPRTRLLSYGHRVSFAYIAAEALSGPRTSRMLATRAAADLCAWDQLGCLSPHVIYVELGGSVSPPQFAELLAEELERREQIEPRGLATTEVAAEIAARRSFFQVRAVASDDTQVWCSAESTAWTVVYEAGAQFQLSCLHRFILVRGVAHCREAMEGADAVREQISTVGLAAPEAKAEQLVRALGEWGVTRICPLGRMQNPPLTWRHDGRPALGDWVRWTDWERETL